MRYFLEVARSEHMTSSARKLHIAQPALTRMMHNLEEEVGTELFERHGRGIRLTESGRLLQRELEPMIAGLDDTLDAIHQQQDVKDRTIRIRMLAASLLTVEALSSWHERDTVAHFEILQQEDRLPADICTDSPLPGEKDPEGIVVRKFTERIMIAVPNDPRFPVDECDLDVFAGERFISLAGSGGFRRTCDLLCQRRDFNPANHIESDNPMVVRQMIALGLGVGFWPEHSWGPLENDDARLVPLHGEDLIRTVTVILGPEGPVNDVSKRFFEFLCDSFEQSFRTRS